MRFRHRTTPTALGLALGAVVLLSAACAPSGPPDPTPPPIGKIVAGRAHTCALMSEGTVKCWGSNEYGQTGYAAAFAVVHAPRTVSGLDDVVDIAAGHEHTCAVLADGTASCWGWNVAGQLGDGTNVDSDEPADVSGLTDAVAIDAGLGHTCALLADGAARCWGNNLFAQLGDGTYTGSDVPLAVAGLHDAIDITAGEYRSCALRADGTSVCWGAMAFPNLNDPEGDSWNVPTPVAGLGAAVGLRDGSHHTCAVLPDRSVACWGANSYGQLGDGSTTSSEEPTGVAELTDVEVIDTGFFHNCALRTDRTVRCWGRSRSGQLGDGSGGDGTLTYSSVPVAVSGLDQVVAVAAGGTHTCAILQDGSGRCWGRDTQGQLGDGADSNAASNVPVTVDGLP